MKTSIKLIVLFTSLPLFVFPQFTFSGGNGEVDAPYVISTLQDLKDFKLATTGVNAHSYVHRCTEVHHQQRLLGRT